MGSALYRKIIVLALLFVLTSLFIYWEPSSRTVRKDRPLSLVLADIKGWKSNGIIPLDPKIINALELDDYANQSYSSGQELVSLYIGYYFTHKKIGAVHDPLVCFPGQGWAPSNKQENKLIVNSNRDSSISYSSMIVQRGLQKELVIYWFQSYDQTTPNTFRQKVSALMQKIQKRKEDNAFVRISISLDKRSVQECNQIIFDFVRSFYPLFLEYVKG